MVGAASAAGLGPINSLVERDFGGFTGEQYRERAMLSAIPGRATLSHEGWIENRCYFGPHNEEERLTEMAYLTAANPSRRGVGQRTRQRYRLPLMSEAVEIHAGECDSCGGPAFVGGDGLSAPSVDLTATCRARPGVSSRPGA